VLAFASRTRPLEWFAVRDFLSTALLIYCERELRIIVFNN
jgi:hypothetical protein